ncbi:unnamed protein product [Didymodactylos carnosus]|uniref:Uncharacterized protein n=1 Tax=Didymodactylos carnosus TaxID=1234261 RepID=A0A815MZQ4_9BILA|nr:unnamed protein product [Didymodactylos carnosus]CAF1429808.1 unnamed protein product [Didymodactylos carnosus]CAF4077348.1 unnamed protein product [Didymodactylos carnosus]CAF4308887.1 unnamed protein product [Didymodactylos carnosus]
MMSIKLTENIKRKQVSNVFDTRWIDRPDAVIVYLYLYINMKESTFILGLCKLEQNYEEILDDVRELCDMTGHEVKMPRITGRQTIRSNVPSTTPQEYYRLNLFIPILDHFIASLNKRFSTQQWLALRVSRLIPAIIE